VTRRSISSLGVRLRHGRKLISHWRDASCVPYIQIGFRRRKEKKKSEVGCGVNAKKLIFLFTSCTNSIISNPLKSAAAASRSPFSLSLLYGNPLMRIRGSKKSTAQTSCLLFSNIHRRVSKEHKNSQLGKVVLLRRTMIFKLDKIKGIKTDRIFALSLCSPFFILYISIPRFLLFCVCGARAADSAAGSLLQCYYICW
jgi:hypothetical protein